MDSVRFAVRSIVLLSLSALLGCRGGVCVNTNSKVTAVLPTAGPVRAMVVERVDANAATKIAIVDVDGVLLNMEMPGPYSQGENPVAVFRERLAAVERDPCVRALVLRINSPGGGVTACDIMRHELVAFRQRRPMPVTACLLDVGAGGAYYLATAADTIIAHPTSVVGGIGVILNVYNLNDAMAQMNVVAAPVKAGENIDLGSPITALGDERRALLQTMADEFQVRFRDTVLGSRQIAPEAQLTIFDGRVVTGQQAAHAGLVDAVGYFDDALQGARQAGNAPEAAAVIYHRSGDPAYTRYDITPNIPLQTGLLPYSVPGLDRARLPTFLYLWQPEPTLEKQAGR
jgi:protease-4